MDVDLVLRILIFTTISKLCAGISGLSNFRVIRKHRRIKECASYILSYKNDYIGGRVSDRTNVCEGLPYSWKWNQTIESGYGYFRKISTNKTFDPPVGVRDDGFGVTIPGTFNTGARLSLYFKIHDEKAENFFWEIKDASNNRGFELRFDSISRKGSFNEVPGATLLIRFPIDYYFQSTVRVQITFVAQNNSIQLRVNGQEITTIISRNVRLDSLAHVALRTSGTYDQTALFLQRFEFRDP